MIEIDLLKIDLLQIWQSLSDQRPPQKNRYILIGYILLFQASLGLSDQAEK